MRYSNKEAMFIIYKVTFENSKARSNIQKEWYAKSENKNVAKQRRLNSIKKYGNNAGKPKKQIKLIDKNDNILIFESLSGASKQLGISIGGLSQLKKQGSGTIKGYKLA